jgi:hypothetical protein
MIWYEKFYIYITYTLYILFFISFFQVSKNAPEYLNELNIIIKSFICLFLLYRFNPLVNNSFTEFDKKIAFDSALYLLFSSLFIDFYLILKKKMKTNKKNEKNEKK